MSWYLEKDKKSESPNQDVKPEQHSQQNSKKQPRKSKSIGKTENSLSKYREGNHTHNGNWGRLTANSGWGQTQNPNHNRTDTLWGGATFTGTNLKRTGFDRFKRNEDTRMVSIIPFI